MRDEPARCVWLPIGLFVSVVLGIASSACSQSAPRREHVTAPVASVVAPRVVSPPPEIEVKYREAADVFELVDNLSEWLPDKCDHEYRAAFIERFGPLSRADLDLFERYAAVRSRYYERVHTRDKTLLGAPPAHDPMAQAFYRSSTLFDAFHALGAFMNAADVAVVRATIESLAPRYAELLKESGAYPRMASTLEQALVETGAARFRARIAHFYGVTEPQTFTVLYVWWPPVESVEANNREGVLLMKYNPTRHGGHPEKEVDVVVHEMGHDVSRRQNEARRRTFSDLYRAGCLFPTEVDNPRAFEEPLTVAQQKIFLRTALHDEFAKTKWYNDPWISTVAKKFFPDVSAAYERGDVLDEALVRRLAASCSEVAASWPHE